MDAVGGCSEPLELPLTVESIVREALTAPADLVDSLKAQAADAIAAIKKPTMTRCNGKVTTKLVVELV